MKKRIILIAILPFLFTSCATIFNQKHQKINFYGDEPNSKMMFKDSVYELPVRLRIERSKSDLKAQYVTNETTENSIRRRLDFKYLPGNIFFTYGAGIAFLVDVKTQKKYKYPSKIVLTHQEFPNRGKWVDYQKQYFDEHEEEIENNRLFVDEKEKNVYEKHAFKSKGDRFHVIQFPSLSIFDIGTKDQRSSFAGLFTVGYGFEKFYTDKMFWSAEATLRTNNFDLILSSLDNYKDDVWQTSLSVHNNHLLTKRWEIGYGLRASYNMLSYETFYYNYNSGIFMSSTRAQIKDRFITIGASFKTSYHLGKGFYGGLSYAPDFVKYADYGNFSEYNATYGIDLRFKF
ncbi:MAG TPA: hypothetical protein VLY87_03765 [Flavobacterium sp.]|nr:hypothetical protein [Flavobacterium sp.]